MPSSSFDEIVTRILPGMRVGIDGVMGSGKTTFADALAAQVPGAVRLSIDDFHRPAEQRIDYYSDAFDLDAFRAAIEAQRETVIADGLFLHKPGIRDVWDLTIWLAVDRSVALERALARDSAWLPDAAARYATRYVPAETRYLEELRPHELADLVVSTA